MSRRVIMSIAIFALVICVVASIILAESAMRLPQSMRTWQIDATADEVVVTATDGAVLRAACFRPAEPVRGAIIALHGVGDHGYSMTGFARLMVEHGYIVLAPDSRGHGVSRGDLITYGLLERHDVTTWLNWLESRFHPPAFYGYGASLGGGILIQSLDGESRFRAIIAECPFADFHTVAYDRVASKFGFPGGLLAPVVEPAFVYARLRYGLNLYDASPVEVFRRVHTPTLLIHGTDDANIPIAHSRRLHGANPTFSELWEVPGGAHVNAWATAGRVYESRVVEWFANH